MSLSEEVPKARSAQDRRTESTNSRGARFALPPDSAGIIARPRLFARLDAKPIVAVIGAAGYGKSALIASWAAHSGRPPDTVAWLTLDRSDRDPGRLAADLLAALQSLAGKRRLGDSLLRFQPPPAFVDPLVFIDALQEALLDTEVPLTLVLDDLQEVSQSQTALEMIDRLMIWMPSRVKIVISSRAVPRLRLQRLRLADRLELISHKELAFTLSETSEAVRAWDPRSAKPPSKQFMD